MNLPGRWVLLSLALPALLGLASCRRTESAIIRVGEGTVVSFEEMIDDFTDVPLVFVGELHNHPGHHRAQLRVIRALAESGRPVSIGLEMFHDGHQEELDAWVEGSLGVEDFIDAYDHNWSSPWPLYRDIFLFARERGLPMVALNASPDLTTLVAARGFASLSPEQLARLPGASCNVDREYEEFIRRALGEHAYGGSSFRHFCEAQMVWDTTMAWKVVDYLEKHPGTTMVVLAGSGHSWRRGIPEQVRRRSGLPFRILLPEVGEHLSRENASREDTDYLWTGL